MVVIVCQREILNVIQDNGGVINSKELRKRLKQSGGHITRQLKSLEDKKVLLRCPNNRDHKTHVYVIIDPLYLVKA